MDEIPESEVDIFHTCARILIAGFSGSGKSYFASKLIRKYKHKFDQIILIGGNLEGVEDLGVVRRDDFNIELDANGIDNILLCFDDILYDSKLMKVAANLYTRGRHKKNSCLMLSQNIFHPSSDFRCISLNSTHIVLMRMRDNRQITHFSSSFLTQEKREAFVKLYKLIVLKEKYRYLLVDFTKNPCSKLMIRTNLFNESLETCLQI